MDAWRPQRRLRLLQSIAARNLVLDPALAATQATQDHNNDGPSEPALSAAADFASGWTLQCTLSVAFAGNAQPMVLYRSEQVPASPNPEWQPLAIGHHPEAAKLLHSVGARRIRVSVSAEPSHASPAAQSHSFSQRPAAPGSAASGAQGSVQPAWAASLHETRTADPAQLRTSDSVDSIELLQGGPCLAAGRSASSGSAVSGGVPGRSGPGSGRRRQPLDAALTTAGSVADQHNSKSRSSNGIGSGDGGSPQQAGYVHSAKDNHAALPAAESAEESPVPAAPPPAALLPSPFALEGGRQNGRGGADGESDGNSDYETASEEGGAGLERAHSASPSRLKPISHARSPLLKPVGGRARGALGDGTQQGAMAAELDPQGSGAAADAVPPNCRSVLTADFQLDQLEFVGPDLAGIEVALLPNTLLLELPSGWYAWPPPSELSGAASVASAAAIEAARASSLAPGFHDYVSSDAELWQAPLQRVLPPPTALPATPPLLSFDSPQSSPRTNGAPSVAPSAAPSPLRAALQSLQSTPAQPSQAALGAAAQLPPPPPMAATADVADVLRAAAAIVLARRRASEADQHRMAAKNRLEQALAVQEEQQRRRRRIDGALAAKQRHEAIAAAMAGRRAARRGAAEVARRIVAAQAAELESALQAMQAAEARLAAAGTMLAGERGAGRLRRVGRALVARRARMVAQLASALGLGFHTVTVMDVPAGGALATRLEASWFGAPSAPGPPPAEQRGQPQQQRRPRTSDVSSPSDGPMGSARDDDAVETSSAAAESIGRDVREVARLAIGGLDLPPALGRRGLDGLLGWEGNPEEELRAAAALGYAALMAGRLAAYLGVPLRYPLHCAASASAVLEAPPPAGTYQVGAWGSAAMGDAVVPPSPAWPLYYDGDRRTRFAYAIFALNKDLEQLLHAHGISSVGPHQVLPNLWTLASAAASALPRPGVATPPPTPGNRSTRSSVVSGRAP